MKNLILACFVLLTGMFCAQVPTTGLISNWPFSGNANDMVGGNNGTVFGATPTTDRFGNSNCAYKFNGSSDYILFVSAGPTGTLSRSVSFWAKTTHTMVSPAVNAVKTAFAYGDSPGAFAIQYNYGCSGVGFDFGSGAYTMSDPNVGNGSWHHYVAVYDNTLGTQPIDIKFYMDGVLLSSLGCTQGTSTTTPINSNSIFPINIGKVADNNIRYFNGDLDDFFLYNRALTPTEILALYNDTPCLATPPSPGAISGNNAVCQGASVVYSVAPVVGATSYTWTLPGGWTGTSTTNTISVVAGANSGQIMVSSGNCCGASQPAEQSITVNPAPVVSITATQFTICNGNSTTLSGNGASTYTWNSFIVTPSITVSPTISTSFTVSGTNSFGCSSTTVTNVVVTNNPLPTILVSGSGASCPGQTVNIAANGASTYTWEPGTLNGFFVSVSPTITTVYTVTGTNSNGCYSSSTYTQSVSTCAGIQEQAAANLQIEIFPNPNNGNFTINLNEVTEKTNLEIYNSVGQLILTKKLQAKQTVLNEKLPVGTYFIKIMDQNTIKGIQKVIVLNE